MAQTDVMSKSKVEVKQPNMYKVIYINDNQTTFDFVIESLIQYFHYDVEPAIKLATTVDTNGFAVVAILVYEIAEQKMMEVTLDARANGYPLQVKIEEDV